MRVGRAGFVQCLDTSVVRPRIWAHWRRLPYRSRVTDEPVPPPAPPTPGAVNRPAIQYKGADLEPERGPGPGCFRFQLIVLIVLVVLTPISVVADWPEAVSAVLLFVVIALLLVTGQNMIFLMRLIAADRRTRRRPLSSTSRTVGELEDAAASPPTAPAPSDDPSDRGGVRQ
jgi:hypothetical protein